MSNKAPLFILLLGVVPFLYFVVSTVTDFSDANEAKNAMKQTQKDSIFNATLLNMQAQDSAVSVLIQEQFIRTEALAKDINNLKYRLNELHTAVRYGEN